MKCSRGNKNTKGGNMMEAKCATCPMRKAAEKNPHSFKARLWLWHTKWCPGWKAYQRELAAQQSREV
jgi:hypothetical protein